MSETKTALDLVSTLTDKVEALNGKVDEAINARNIGAKHVPFARTGESILSSRGFSFARIFAAKAGRIDKSKAKIELDLCDRFQRQMHKSGWRPQHESSTLVPFAPDFFSEDQIDDQMYSECKSVLNAGINGADEELANWRGSKSTISSPVSPAMSWVQQGVGGSFVPPAGWGQPIELLRNHEVMLNAGATMVPLGPTGRMQFPRLTGPTQGGWAGENTFNAPVNPSTDLLTLSAKKVISLVAIPNELLRFGSPALEALVRNDMFKTVALIADKGFLDGQGSDNVPLGLATMGGAAGNPYGLAIVTPTNSNQLSPENVYDFLSGIEENNGSIENVRWIMRPKMAYAFYQSRWTPYSGGTSQGGFVFEIVRGFDGKPQKVLAGCPVVSSTQVSNTRGSGAQTYVIALDGPDYLVGMFGAIEFFSTDQGWTLLSSDQTAVRAVLTCDGAPRHPGLVAFCDSLNFTVAG